MAKTKKKKYEKPEVKRVALDVQVAVLGACKVNGSTGPRGSNCGFPSPMCRIVTS
jgi:hypothetical protein